MHHQDLIDKISFHIDSFQEGFKILSGSRNLRELAKNYCHILRGSLLTSYVNLYHLRSEDQVFAALHEQKMTDLIHKAVSTVADHYSINSYKEEQVQAVVLPANDKSKFLILIGPCLDEKISGEYQEILIQLFSQLLDNAYQSFLMRQSEKNLVFALNNRILQLNSLIDTGIELSKLHQINDLLLMTLRRAVSITNATIGELTVRKGRKILTRLTFPETSAKQRNAVKRKSGNQIETKFKYHDDIYILSMYAKESRDGIIPFDDTDTLLLQALSRQMQATIENNYLQQQALEMEKVKQELAVAASIQQRILPEALPEIEGYDLAGLNIPTIEVCGDYYDCIPINNQQYILIMADVSGKGIPAALLVSSLQASLRVYLESDLPLAAIANKLNKLIYQATTSEKYLTMSICFLDVRSGRIEAVNAGHNPPLVLKNDGRLQKIKTGGIPIGMADLGLEYKSEELILNPGDSLLMFTDGITEAMNHHEEMYEDERLESLLIRHQQAKAGEFIDYLIADVEQFVDGAEQSDDITVLFLKRQP